jgi:hypothetical protein
MVRNDDESKFLLDDSSQAKDKLQKVHERVSEFMHFDSEKEKYTLNEHFIKMFGERPP